MQPWTAWSSLLHRKTRILRSLAHSAVPRSWSPSPALKRSSPLKESNKVLLIDQLWLARRRLRCNQMNATRRMSSLLQPKFFSRDQTIAKRSHIRLAKATAY